MQEMFKRNNLNILQLKIDVANTGHITNCYIVWDKQNNAVVIDPAFDAKRIIQELDKNNLTLKAIFLTHCHADHIGALQDLLNEFDVAVYGHKYDVDNINNADVNCKQIVGIKLENLKITNFKCLDGGENICISDMNFTIINTPRSYKGKYSYL